MDKEEKVNRGASRREFLGGIAAAAAAGGCRSLFGETSFYIGPEKSLLMGVYMWDYTLGRPVPADRMEMQLAFALRLLREKVVTGLIFHPTYSAALDVPSVNLAKQWIRAHGEDIWGV